MSKPKDGCVKPAGGPLINKAAPASTPSVHPEEANPMLAKVGREAPDFEATAFIPQTGDFQPVKLSDYKGKWITLCFYPGDFTFV